MCKSAYNITTTATPHHLHYHHPWVRNEYEYEYETLYFNLPSYHPHLLLTITILRICYAKAKNIKFNSWKIALLYKVIKALLMKTKTFSLTINKYKEQEQKKCIYVHSTVFINKFSTFTCSRHLRRPPPPGFNSKTTICLPSPSSILLCAAYWNDDSMKKLEEVKIKLP